MVNLKLKLGREVSRRTLNKKESPIVNQVRKILANVDQKLIVMVRG